METSLLGHRFEQALLYACHLHQDQTRKGSAIPYIAHLLAVTSLVIEEKGDEDLAVAALLHDAVEDQGGVQTLDEIRQRFGERVAAIVDSCTDTYDVPKPPWRPRKERYLEHLRSATPDARLVSLCDKVHNARSILNDLRREGQGVWDRFTGGKNGTLWYYHSLVDIFQQIETSPLVQDLAWTVSELERINGVQSGGPDVTGLS